MFAANADNTALHSSAGDVTILESALAKGAEASMSNGLLNPSVSKDVQALVDMHDHGRLQAFEVKDTSYKALLQLAQYLNKVLGKVRQNGLSPELLAQAVKFVKSVPAEQVFVRLEVTDKKPRIPDFNPSHMCAYDTERAHGTDYLQIARRLTIHGSSSSVMNNTDLGTFLERGRKKSVVLYLGTQKNDDIQFLNPAHAMALDLVVSGLEQDNDVDELFEKAEIILLHPELAELQQEAASLQILLTDFLNDLDPETGKELATRLINLQKGIESLPDVDFLVEFTTPLAELVETMLTDDMVQEVIEKYDLLAEKSTPISVQLENLQTAIDFILVDPTLSPEARVEKIIALLQVGVPSLLESSTVTNSQIIVFLENLQTTLDSKEIYLAMPLLVQPAIWDASHSGQLANLILLLSYPEQAQALKESLQETTKGLRVLEALEQLSETLDLQNIQQDILQEKIHEALTSTTAENAVTAANLLQVMVLTHNPQIVSLLPEPLQLALYSFAQGTLPAQHGLAMNGMTERLSQLTNGDDIIIDFNPPQALSTSDNSIRVFPFLVQPVMATLPDLFSLKQVPEFLKSITDPARKKELQDQIEALQLLQAIETLRTEDSGRPHIPASSLDALLLKIESGHDFINSIPKDTLEGAALAEIPKQVSPIIEDRKGMDRVAFTEHVREALLSPTPETSSLANEFKNIIHQSSNQKATEVLLQQILKDSSFLPSLTPDKQNFVAAVVAKTTLTQVVKSHDIPATLQNEVKAALQSKHPEKMAQIVQRVLETSHAILTPKEISTLKAIAPVLAQTAKYSPGPSATPVSPSTSGPIRQAKRKSDEPPIKHDPPTSYRPSEARQTPSTPPKREPVRPTNPTNDNPLPETKPISPVCPKGNAICLCDEFKNAAEGLQVGDKKKLENGVILTAEELRVNEDGTKETIYSLKDGAKTVFKGTTTEIEEQIEANIQNVEKDTEKYKNKFESEPPPIITGETTFVLPEHQDNITVFETKVSNKDKVSSLTSNVASIDEISFEEDDFGSGESSPSFKHPPSGFTPK
jgi:hypothetical protein